MKKIFCLIIIFTAIYNQTNAQGCVAIRNTGAVCSKPGDPGTTEEGWQLNAAYRYYKSFRHYRGKHEEKERVENGSDVRNFTNSLDISIVRNLNSRWSLSLNVPLLSTRRSSLYEHDGKTRHNTSTTGIGDIRFSAYRWLLNPAKSKKGNIQLGLGIKLPTGDYKYQDFFYKNDSTQVLGPVDQSIQLGDGGTGFTTEINAYYNIKKWVGFYANFYYLFNPREQNGVSTARGGTPSATNIRFGSSTMSVADQYMVRAGSNFTVKNFTGSIGGRMECVPSEDLIGGSSGFRRPGYVISVEPAVSYQFKKFSTYLTVPIALERNRTQSVPDKLRTKATGTFTQGDAAFADYSINIGFSVKL